MLEDLKLLFETIAQLFSVIGGLVTGVAFLNKLVSKFFDFSFIDRKGKIKFVQKYEQQKVRAAASLSPSQISFVPSPEPEAKPVQNEIEIIRISRAANQTEVLTVDPEEVKPEEVEEAKIEVIEEDKPVEPIRLKRTTRRRKTHSASEEVKLDPPVTESKIEKLTYTPPTPVSAERAPIRHRGRIESSRTQEPADELETANFRLRLFSFMIDYTLGGAIVWLGVALGSDGRGLLGWGHLVQFIYLFIRDGLGGGQGIGKKLMGIKVIKTSDNQSPASLGDSILRSISLILTLFILDGIVMLRDDKGRRLGDRFAHTRVIMD